MQQAGPEARKTIESLAGLAPTLGELTQPLALVGKVGPALEGLERLKSLEIDVPILGTVRPWNRLTSTFEAFSDLEQGLATFAEISQTAGRLSRRMASFSDALSRLPSRWSQALEGGVDEVRTLSGALQRVLSTHADLARILGATLTLANSLSSPLNAARSALRSAKKLPYVGEHVTSIEVLLTAADAALGATVAKALTGAVSKTLGNMNEITRVAEVAARCEAP